MAYTCVTALRDIQDYLAQASTVAFDFETSPLDAFREESRAALDPHRASITGVSLSVQPETGIYIPLRHRSGGNADPAGVIPLLAETVFENPRILKIAHNLAFEAAFLYALGIVVQPPCYDTIAAAQLTLQAPGKFRPLADSGLKTLVPHLFGVDLPAFAEVTAGRSFDALDPQDPETVRYACGDADFALRLYDRVNAWLDQQLPGHRRIVERVESPTAVYVGIMRYNGLLMDTETMDAKRDEAAARLAEQKAAITAMVGGVNIGANASTSAFKKYLYNDLGLPVLKTTAKHQEAADDEAMLLLADYCRKHRPELVRLFQLVQAYRRLGKTKGTYLDGYLRFVNPVTGRIHPDLLPLATETGRFASRNPNMQNAPRKGNDPLGIRGMIVAPPGCKLLSLDFSQIELRVGAFYCRDPRMLETYRIGGDIHTQTASAIYGISLEEAGDRHSPLYKERRTIAKNCNFGIFYGLFPRGLQRTLKVKAGLDVSFDQCAQIIHNLKAGYPWLAKWQEIVKKQIAIRQYTETWMGRRRYLPGITSQDWGTRSFAERCALNTPIQGTAADILKLALGRIIEGLPARPWLRPILQIHDELVFEVPDDRIPEAVDFVRTCMEARPFPEFDVPIVAEAAVGPTFGDMTEWEA